MSHYEHICGHPGCTGRICLDQQQYDDAQTNGTPFYCSFGHQRAFRPSEVEKLRDRVKELERTIDKKAADQARKSVDRAWYEAEQMVDFHRDQAAAFRCCPFANYDACPQGHYEYASPEQLARHLSTQHGVEGLWHELRVVRAS
jgi:hypothetical protein